MVWCQIQSHHVPSYITYQFRNVLCGVAWSGPRSPQLIEIFINISLPDIYQQQKQVPRYLRGFFRIRINQTIKGLRSP